MVVLLCNLKPAKMRGIVSEAMVMCASTPDKVEILAPPEGAVPGDLVTVAGYEGKPDDVIKPTNKKAVSVFEQVAPDLKTNAACEATYKVKNKLQKQTNNYGLYLGCRLGSERKRKDYGSISYRSSN